MFRETASETVNAPMHISAHDISAKLAEQIEEICRERLPRGCRRGREWSVGSVAGERGYSLRVKLDGQWRGHWCDWATGERGDALGLVQAVLQLATTRDAIDWAVDWLAQHDAEARGDTNDASSTGTINPTDDERRRIEAARHVWRNTEEAAGSDVEDYLRNRGIKIHIPPSIRYAPTLWHGPIRCHFPAMVAAIEDVEGKVIGVHRTYLTPDGAGKAEVSPSKMMLGRCAGGAVRLASPGRKLVIAEGIETALSIAQACPKRHVWAALSTSGMRKLLVPRGVDEVILCPDGDEPGEHATSAAAKRFLFDGLRVRIARPPEGTDFNDVLVNSQAAEAA